MLYQHPVWTKTINVYETMLVKQTLTRSWLHLQQGQITWKVQGIEG